MKIIDNINTLLGDDLKASIHPKAKPKIAASCFSIYAYEALKSELAKIDSLEFIFTAPINPDFMKSRRISAFRTSTSFGTSKSPLALPIRFPAGAFSRKCKKRIKNHEHPDPHPVIVGKRMSMIRHIIFKVLEKCNLACHYCYYMKILDEK